MSPVVNKKSDVGDIFYFVLSFSFPHPRNESRIKFSFLFPFSPFSSPSFLIEKRKPPLLSTRRVATRRLWGETMTSEMTKTRFIGLHEYQCEDINVNRTRTRFFFRFQIRRYQRQWNSAEAAVFSLLLQLVSVSGHWTICFPNVFLPQNRLREAERISLVLTGLCESKSKKGVKVI